MSRKKVEIDKNVTQISKREKNVTNIKSFPICNAFYTLILEFIIETRFTQVQCVLDFMQLKFITRTSFSWGSEHYRRYAVWMP